MSEEKNLNIENEEIKEPKNNFELDDSWLDELDDFDVEPEHNDNNNSQQIETHKVDNLANQTEKSANSFLNKLFDNNNVQSNSEKDFFETNDNNDIELLDLDNIEDNNEKSEESVLETNNKPNFNLDDLIRKYEEKYNLNSPKKSNDFQVQNQPNLTENIMKSNISEEEKDNKLAENYVNRLSLNDRKAFDNFEQKQQNVIVPQTKPEDDDDFEEFRQMEQDFQNHTTKTKKIRSSTKCKDKLSKFSKISGFNKKYLFFLIALALITVGATIYLYLTLWPQK